MMICVVPSFSNKPASWQKVESILKDSRFLQEGDDHHDGDDDGYAEKMWHLGDAVVVAFLACAQKRELLLQNLLKFTFK